MVAMRIFQAVSDKLKLDQNLQLNKQYLTKIKQNTEDNVSTFILKTVYRIACHEGTGGAYM
jgi:hypothetical protein